jgi:glycine cleavage system pyridoxal-binding protein P
MFIPHTDAEREAMLRTIGAGSLEELFSDVPAKFLNWLFPRPLLKWKHWQRPNL